MSAITRLRDESKRAAIQADEAVQSGNIARGLELMEEATKHATEANELEASHLRFQALKGEFNAATNPIPLTDGERKTYDPSDNGAKYNTSYRPAGWVKSMDGRPLSPAIQPKWVRDQMGQALKDEAKFYANAWEKWFRTRSSQQFWNLASPAEAKAMQENTDVEGGFFVPEEFRTIVLHDPGAPGGIHRPFCSTLTTSLKDGYFPTFGSVTWAAIAEEATFGDNTPAVGQVSFNVAKSGGKVDISAELLEDAATNLPALLSQIFNEARGRYEDTKIIAGSGSGEPEGLRTALGASQTVTLANATSIVATDINKIYWNLPAQYRGGSGVIWSLSSQLMMQIENIGATAAGIHFVGPSGYGDPNNPTAPPEMLRGRRVITFDGTGWDDAAAIATTEVLGAFGDFKQYYLIDRIGMSLRRDDSVASANDQVRFYARSRFDGRVGVVNAFRLIKAA